MSEENAELVRMFFKNETVLIVEPSSSFSQTVVECIHQLGAALPNIKHVKRYEEAYRFIEQAKPKVLLTEYFVGDKFGLALVDKQGEYWEEASKVSMLVTHNVSASAVAEAAEEHVDAYIVKPFSMADFRQRITEVIRKKIKPSDYMLAITEGKKHLVSNEFEEASNEFTEALKLNTKPILAHYYLGHTRFKQKKYEEAVSEFQKGKAINPLHYKCLVGEFDALFEQKKFIEAYKLIPTIRSNFPLNPQRLGNVFVVAVYSSNFQDIMTYYDLFQKLDCRPPQLIKIFSAALQTAAKYYLKEKSVDKALSCYELGLSVAGLETTYLVSVIKEMLKNNMADKAVVFLNKFPREHYGSKSHSQLSFLVDRALLPPHQVIEKGRKLVAQGFADEDCYRSLVQLLVKAEKKTMAEDVIAKAVKDFPDLRKELYSFMEE